MTDDDLALIDRFLAAGLTVALRDVAAVEAALGITLEQTDATPYREDYRAEGTGVVRHVELARAGSAGSSSFAALSLDFHNGAVTADELRRALADRAELSPPLGLDFSIDHSGNAPPHIFESYGHGEHVLTLHVMDGPSGGDGMALSLTLSVPKPKDGRPGPL